jgi:chemotaxis protein methyltransferase CheR
MSALAPKLSADASTEPLVEGEFAFTTDDFRRITTLLYEDSGIHLPNSKVTLVYSRLAKRLRALGLRSFRQYCDLVSSQAGSGERRAMLTALTTNVTRFFREPHHFDHFREQTLTPLLDQARAGGRLRFWSAGCSSGEEPYSLALTVLSILPEAADLDVRILATDIDPAIIARARKGVYDQDAIAPIPQALRGRWLERAGETQWRVGDAARRLVVFNELNLMSSWPMKGRFQAIFCRNVAIYFDDPTQAKLWERFADALEPGGRLYIGHSERAGSDRFENDGLTSYRLRSGRR